MNGINPKTGGNEPSNNGLSQSQYPPPPPPPSDTSGWIHHIPVLEPDQLPRAPTTFVFGTDIASDETTSAKSLRSSSKFNEYLQYHHPTYAPPTLPQAHEERGQSALVPSQIPSLQSLTRTLDFSASYRPPFGPASSSAYPDISSSSTSLLYPDNTSLGLSGLSPRRQQVQGSQDVSQPWRPVVGITQVPHGPQDFGDGNKQLSARHYGPGQGSRQSHLRFSSPHTTSSNYDVSGDNSSHAPIMGDDETEPGPHPTFEQFKASRKRMYTDSTLGGENEGQMQGLKPKKSRKRVSQADIPIDPQLDEIGVDEVEQTNKSRTEPRGRGRPKGQKVGLRPTLDPGPEFMSLYNQAMDAFIEENDTFTAQTKILQAIGLNPEIFAAHSLLADIHFAKGDYEKGLDALIGGLHAHMNDVELWRQVADTILTDNHEAPQKRLERAMYCFGAILRKDPKDMDARFQRAECARLLGQVNRAFGDLNILLQDDPHNSSVLAQFTKLCHDVEDVPKAKLMYEEHFDFYKIQGISEDDSFTWQDIGIYVDLMTQLGETAQAIVMLKRLSRWLCGRRDEDFWEEYLEDDREFDQNHYPRRLEVVQFEPNIFPEQDYGEALPLDIRAKLGILRLKLNYREEAQSHFDWLEADIDTGDSMVEEYSDTFLEIAKALHDVKEHKEALRFYSALETAGIDLGFDFWIGFGASAYVCEQKEKAILAYEQALVVNPPSIEARTQLAKLYRDLGDRQNALKYGREAVVMSQDAIPQTGNRKYENKENRLLREAAERALKGAYRLPRKPDGAAGKVPDSLKYRTRYKSKFIKYVPRQTEEPQSGSADENDGPTPVHKEKAKKFGPHKKKGRPAKPPKETDKAAETSKETGSEPRSSSRPYRKQPSKIDPQKHYEDLQLLYQTLCKYQSAMRDGDGEATSHWLDCARSMVDDFRTVKVFFPSERHKKFDGYPTAMIQPHPSSNGPIPNDRPPDQPAHSPPTDTVTGIVNSPSTTPIRMVERGVPNHYCGIPFQTWLDIFLELALVTANSAVFRSGERDLQTNCYSIINAALDCNVFYHHPPTLTQIYTVYLSCCLALNDDVTLYNTVLRWFMNEFAFCTDTYRLYSAVALVGEYTNLQGKSRLEGSMYRDSSNQKYLFRQLCSIDQQLPKDYGVGTDYGPVPSFMRRERDGLRKQRGKDDDAAKAGDPVAQSPAANVANEDTPPTVARTQSRSSQVPMGSVPRRDRLGNPIGLKDFSPKDMDVVLFILYSHIMMANNSFTNALNYLFRAHSLDPSNTVCLLSMALCYLTELFKRQVGNRHALSLMGWVWFGKYEVERRKWATQIDGQNAHMADGDEDEETTDGKVKMIDLVNREIEFNRARCWEMLGMADLAVRGYKKTLALPSTRRSKVDNGLSNGEEEEEEAEEPETFDMEAAYALSTIYMINGNGEKAREIAERHMVVE